MTIFTDEDLDQPGGVPETAAPLMFTDADVDGPIAKVPPPPKPKPRPQKRPRQPLMGGATLTEMRKQAQGFSVEGAAQGVRKVLRTGAGMRAQARAFEVTEGLAEQPMEVEGGQSRLQLNVPAADSFAPEGTTLTEVVTEAPRTRLGAPRRRDGESLDDYLIRAAQVRSAEKGAARQARAERAQVRARLLPRVNPLLAAGTSAAEGLGEVYRQAREGVELLGGQPPNDVLGEAPMPRLNEAQSEAWLTGKIPQALGSVAAFGAAGAAGGPLGVALMGAAQNAGQTYEEARGRGVGHDEALRAAVPGALIGALEGVGGEGGVGHGFLKGTAHEVAQEVTSQALNNINAKFVSGYDPQRAITEGLWETAALAGLIGGATHAAGNVGEAERVVQRLAEVPGQLDAKLRELGVEQSWGELPDEAKRAGVELYAGVDPKLVRDYLPRPETIKSLFSSLFKGIKRGLDPADGKRIESARLRLFEQIAARKAEKMAQIEPIVPIEEATSEQVTAVMDRPELPEVFEDRSWKHSLRDPQIAAQYDVQYKPTGNGSMDWTLEITHKPTGQKVGEVAATEPDADFDANTQGKFLIAKDSYERFMRHEGPWLELSEGFADTYREMAWRRQRAEVDEVERGTRLAEKHARRWLDKQRWEAERRQRKAGAAEAMDVRIGDSPQGIVVHKISPQNLARLIAEAGGDLEQATQPAPSIGVIHPETDFDSFGGVQLVATPSLVEDAVKAGTAYPTDFYTPTAAEALANLGEDRITPDNVHKIVQEMVRQSAEYGEKRLSEPQAVFSNGALMNSYAKAGGAWESVEAMREGLAALRPERTRGDVPEFEATREAQQGFNEARRALAATLNETLPPLDVMDLPPGWTVDVATGAVFDEDGDEVARYDRKGSGKITGTVDQYLLTQLSKPGEPSAERLEAGLRRILSEAGVNKAELDQTSPTPTFEMYWNSEFKVRPIASATSIQALKEKVMTILTGEGWGYGPQEVRDMFNAGKMRIEDAQEWALGGQVRKLAEQAATAFRAFREAPTIYMEAQPPRGVRLDEYVAALVPLGEAPVGWGAAGDMGPGGQLDAVADRLVAGGLRVYRYGSPEEKVAIQKALAQFKDLAVDPSSSYGALYSNPVFDPEAWKRAVQAWLPGQGPDPEVELLNQAEHKPGEGGAGEPSAGPPPGAGGQPAEAPEPSLMQELLKSEHIKDLSAKVQDEMRRAGVELDASLPPYLQVARALRDQPDLLRANPAIVQALEESGLTEEKLVGAYTEAVSEAGRMLKGVQGEQAYIRRLVQEDPGFARRALGNARFQKEGLAVLGDTELGFSKWQRAFGLTQAMAISRVTTLMTNMWSTAFQLPLDMMAGTITALGQVTANPEAYRDVATEEGISRARAALRASIEPALQVVMSMPARALEKLPWLGDGGSERLQQQRDALARLTQLYPDEMAKLKGIEYASSASAENRAVFDELAASFAEGKPATAQQREYARQWKELAARDSFNRSLAGKALGATEYLYSLPLKPLVWQEMAFREPYFVGALDRALQERGHSIEQLTSYSTVPREAVEDAVNAALTATWGYRPDVDNEHLGGVERAAERAGAYMIKGFNALGPLNALGGELFPRALANSVKFAWEWGPWGAVSPGWRIASKVAGGERAEVSRVEAERIARAIVGTAMYALAYSLQGQSKAGDDEWYKVPTGLKDAKGRPLGLDARQFPQLAFFMKGADLMRRYKDGRLTDVEVSKELREVYLNARVRSADAASMIDTTLKYWSSGLESEQAWLKGQVPLGQALSLPVTPLQNLTMLLAQWDPEQDVLRDTQARPLLGPTLDKLPWLRSKLPVRQPLTEPAPQEASGRPAGTLGAVSGPISAFVPGFKVAPGLSFASREFARLGLKPTHFLAPDPDPAINRAQYAAYAEILGELSRELERDPTYAAAPAAEQAATWERLLGGPEGLAKEAREAGLAANPLEVNLRQAAREGGGPLQNKASGLAKELEGVRKAEKPK